MKKYKIKVNKKLRIKPNQPDYLGLKNYKSNKIDDSQFIKRSNIDAKNI